VHRALAAKVIEEKQRSRPLILNKSSKEKEEKHMFKEDLQLTLDQLEKNRSGSSKKYVQTRAEERRNERWRHFEIEVANSR
jgi:hypothetical protein